MRALIVDDSDIFVYVAKTALEGAGFDVRVARSLAEGRTIVQAGAPDVACVDGFLPDGDGRVLCAELRELSSAVAIVLVSAAPDMGAREDGSAADVVLEKPDDPELLVAAVRSAVVARRRG
jgi:CheY-like chemotaxis protein